MLLGVVVFAAGLKKAAQYAGSHVYLPYALLLGGGVGLFLLADVWFRRVLRIGRLRFRAIGGFVALATVPLGLVNTIAQLGSLVAVVAMVIFAETLTN